MQFVGFCNNSNDNDDDAMTVSVSEHTSKHLYFPKIHKITNEYNII